MGAWKSVQLKHYPAYEIIIISLIIQRNLARKIRAKWESSLTTVRLKQDPPVYHLHIVFKKFQKAGLKIKINKCQFFKTHLHYLGHRTSANGLEPLPEKLEVIKNLTPARNVNETRQILGLLGYYRSFVPAFADITLPITSLLKKNRPFVWSEKC